MDAAHFPELKCLRAAASPGTTPHSKSKILTTHLLRLLLARWILELIFCIFFTFKTRYVIDMEDVGPVSVFVEGDVEKMKVSFPPPNWSNSSKSILTRCQATSSWRCTRWAPPTSTGSSSTRRRTWRRWASCFLRLLFNKPWSYHHTGCFFTGPP